MKKITLAALAAAVAVAGQVDLAQAAGTKARPRAVESREAERSLERAGKTVSPQSQARQTSNTVRMEISKSGLDQPLSYAQKTDLNNMITADANVRQAAYEIVKAPGNKKFAEHVKELNQARLEALLYIKGKNEVSFERDVNSLDPAQRNNAIYGLLATKVAKQATTWNDAATISNVGFLLSRSNRYLASGQTPGKALQEAAVDLKAEKQVEIDLAQIPKLCK